MKTYAEIIGINTTEGIKAAQKRSEKLPDVSDDLIYEELKKKKFQRFVDIVLRDAEKTFGGYSIRA